MASVGADRALWYSSYRDSNVRYLRSEASMSTENVAGAWSKLDNLELTPAASEALDLNADLFKRQVLHELSRTHSRRGYRVRVSDVQLAADQVVAKGPRSAKVVRLLTRLALILAGIALFVQTLISLTGVGQSWVVSAAALLTGISTGTATVLVIQEFRGRRKETTASRGFLWEIQALEWSARQAVKQDRKSTRLNSSHLVISYAVFC